MYYKATIELELWADGAVAADQIVHHATAQALRSSLSTHTVKVLKVEERRGNSGYIYRIKKWFSSLFVRSPKGLS
jgi:hypothetical protein